ncbi:MAG: lipopolysaccharide biosynthesis protein [Limisphaerales bacterium]
MSRFKRFTNALLSGYMLLGVNALFTLASVPLALHYLDKEEFGLWATTAQLAGYIALVDFGLGSAAARILIDYKEHQEPREYGSTILTAVCVGFTQGALIFLAGVLLAFVIGPLLHIPAKLEREFFWLVIGQAGVTALMFATRITGHILNAHQRFDVTNHSGALALVINCGTMWWGFSHGLGVFSMLWGQAAGVLTVVVVNLIGCSRLKLLPRRGEWGRPNWNRFCELFVFGRDLFLYTVGSQLVNTSQTLLLTRLIGLDAAATWSVCTRAYLLLVQVISRVFDYSTSALAEMMVRREHGRLLHRFREIAVLSVNLSVAAGVLFAITNAPFVKIWMAGKFGWSPWNDWLLALWLVICICVRVHTGLVGQTKAFRFMRYIYFLEGLAFIGLTILLHRLGGITMMLVISVLCSLCFTFPYGLWRTCKYFDLTWRDLVRWHRGTLALAATVAPVAALVWWLTLNLPALQRLAADSVLGIWTALMFLRYGLGASLRAEVCRFAPGWFRPVLAGTGIGKSEA